MTSTLVVSSSAANFLRISSTCFGNSMVMRGMAHLLSGDIIHNKSTESMPFLCIFCVSVNRRASGQVLVCPEALYGVPRNRLSSRPAAGVLERQPGAILLRAGHALGDEVHPVHAVGHVRVEAGGSVHLLARG